MSKVSSQITSVTGKSKYSMDKEAISVPKLSKPLFTATSGGFSGGASQYSGRGRQPKSDTTTYAQKKKRKLLEEQQKKQQELEKQKPIQQEHKNKKRNYTALLSNQLITKSISKVNKLILQVSSKIRVLHLSTVRSLVLRMANLTPMKKS